ncbi:DUF3667 domain-containing protein [Tenacibaculum sp. MEBiC06402]|uniref:DUF3667 domain-containing protein n=1 Tax=unclassified Tenacibaculum TaxID=2635139 RepID=UPI003B9992B9
MICISCNHEHNEKFCPNCGEKAGTPKITVGSTVESTFSTITNMDKGFLYNLKNLTLKPKITIEKYLKGKRKGIFNPISFLIIAVTLYLIVESLFKSRDLVSEENVNLVKDTLSYKIGATGGAFIYNYFKFFWVFTVIPLSFITKLIFKRFNFAEHITINSFILGQVTLIIGLASFIIFRFPIIFNPFIYVFLMLFIYRVFYESKNKWDALIKAFTSVIFFVITLFLIAILIGFMRID